MPKMPEAPGPQLFFRLAVSDIPDLARGKWQMQIMSEAATKVLAMCRVSRSRVEPSRISQSHVLARDAFSLVCIVLVAVCTAKAAAKLLSNRSRTSAFSPRQYSATRLSQARKGTDLLGTLGAIGMPALHGRDCVRDGNSRILRPSA